jgi:hypothetical protein
VIHKNYIFHNMCISKQHDVRVKHNLKFFYYLVLKMRNKLWALMEWSTLWYHLCEGELIDIVNCARRDVENAFSSSTSSSKYSLVAGLYVDVMNNYLHNVQIALF